MPGLNRPLTDIEVKQALAYLDLARAVLNPPAVPSPVIISVTAGQSIQSAIDRCPDGGAIEVEPGTYTEALTLGAKAVAVRSAGGIPAGRRSPLWKPVVVTSPGPTVTIQGPGQVTLSGLACFSTNADNTIVTDLGTGTVLDRLLVMGDPTKGQHRGILAHGTGCVYDGLYVDNCGLPGRDACALGGWDGTNGLVVTNAYLAGGAQAVLFGGADSASVGRIPTNILFQRCLLTKNPAWFGLGWQIKTGLELKAAQHFAIEDSVIRYAGVSAGQAANLILLTPRNQGNTAPWSEVTDIRIERVVAQYGGGGLLLLGKDDTNPSGPLARVTVRDVAFLDLDPKSPVWTQPSHVGSGRVVSISTNPQSVTLERITATGTNLAAAMYITKPATGLVLRDWKMPATTYGYKVDAGGTGIAALQSLMPDAVIALNPATDQGAQNLPPLP